MARMARLGMLVGATAMLDIVVRGVSPERLLGLAAVLAGLLGLMLVEE